MLQNIFANLFGGVGNGNAQMMGGFHKTLTKADFGLPTTVTPVVGTWVRLGAYRVRPQQTVSYGYGRKEDPVNQGYMFIRLATTGAAPGVVQEGLVRLIQTNNQETITYTVFEDHTEPLRSHTADRNQKIPLPEQVQFPLVGEDSALCLEIMMDTVTVVDRVNSHILVPVTIYQ